MKTNKFEFSTSEQDLLIGIISEQVRIYKSLVYPDVSYHKLLRLESILKTLKNPGEPMSYQMTLTGYKPALPMTPQGKFQLLQDMLNPQDEDGNPMEPLISQDEAMELLNEK